MSEYKSNVVLECKDLRISFSTLSGTVKAVRGISFDLEKGKTLAIVGESGSGKSVTSRAILGILANNKIVEGGQILYDGKDLLQLSEDQFTSIRGSKISMIFQDPLSSLNPIMKVGKQLTEPMFLKAKTTRKEAKRTFKNYLKTLKASLVNYDITSGTIDEFVKQLDLLRNQKASLAKIEKNLAKEEEKLSEVEEESENYEKVLALRDQLALAQKDVEVTNTYINNYFEADDVKNAVKDILSDSQALYIEHLHLLRQSIIDFKEEVLITTFDYKSKIIDIYKEIDKLIDERLKKDAEYHDAIAKVAALKGTPDFIPENLENLKIAKKAIDEEYINRIKDLRASTLQVIDFSPKLALQRIKEIQAKILECDYPYAVEHEDIVSVFATSFKKYILDYIQAIELNDENVKFLDQFNDYNTGVKSEVPAKLRAKRREIIVPFYEFYERMINSIDSIVKYIQKELIEKTFDVDVYYSAFTAKFIEQKTLASTRVKKSEAKKRALELLAEVGIPEPERRYYQYPFEFSGGMRQRIVIAIALSSNPEILICDEPTTALDVTIQAQILELINKMKVEHNLSIIFITHDLGVVANMADDIAVMYAGKIVEKGTVYDIFYDPRHPYTWALLGSMPDLDTKDKLEAIPGTPPNMLLPPKGDAFAARNKYAMKIDYKAQPPFFKVSDTHSAATWLLHEDAPKASAPKVVIERIKNSLAKNSNNKPIYTNPKNSILEEGGDE